jgi:hypothetical protein
VRVGRPRLERERLLVVRERFLRASELHQRIAPIVQRADAVRVYCERLVETPHRLVSAA